jgi:hypothetical protein
MSGEANSKKTPERIAAITQALRAGNTRRAAAQYAEIDHATLYRWLEDDATFRDAVEKAEADSEVRFVAQVAQAATGGTWQAAAWWLERRRGVDWKRQETVEVTGSANAPLVVKQEGQNGTNVADTLAVLAEIGVIALVRPDGETDEGIDAETDEVRAAQSDESTGGIPSPQ